MDKNGLINILPLVPTDELITKAIPYIRMHFDEGEDEVKFDIFWNYFTNTWIRAYEPSSWNIEAILNNPDKDEIMVNRTNNPLENFNRRMNDSFPTAHPNMQQFVGTVNQIAHEYVDELVLIKHNKRGKRKQHNILPTYNIPADYASWKLEYE